MSVDSGFRVNKQAERAKRSSDWATFVTFGIALAFFAFFQLPKLMPALADTYPWAIDPYDAVGSFGFQIAVFIGLLSLLRTVRHLGEQAIPLEQVRFIVRGDELALLAVALSLLADVLALDKVSFGFVQTEAGRVMVFGLATLLLASVLASVLVARVVFALHAAGAERGRLLGAGGYDDIFDDLLWLAHTIKAGLGRDVPIVRPALDKAEKAGQQLSEGAAVRWLSPRRHPWLFCLAVAVVVGLGLTVGHALGEGVPSDPSKVVFVSLFFFSVEAIAVVVSLCTVRTLPGHLSTGEGTKCMRGSF